jgi:hypothetical protein
MKANSTGAEGVPRILGAPSHNLDIRCRDYVRNDWAFLEISRGTNNTLKSREHLSSAILYGTKVNISFL